MLSTSVGSELLMHIELHSIAQNEKRFQLFTFDTGLTLVVLSAVFIKGESTQLEGKMRLCT